MLNTRENREKLIALSMVPFIAAGAMAFGAFGVVGSIIAFGFATAGVVVLGSFVVVQLTNRSGVLGWFLALTGYFLLIILLGFIVALTVPF